MVKPKSASALLQQLIRFGEGQIRSRCSLTSTQFSRRLFYNVTKERRAFKALPTRPIAARVSRWRAWFMFCRRSNGKLGANERWLREVLVTREICSQSKNDDGVRTRVIITKNWSYSTEEHCCTCVYTYTSSEKQLKLHSGESEILS